jgi:NAD(P)-dependent dehydrogenase (short-subunit alcohol dehydrogenase family)
MRRAPRRVRRRFHDDGVAGGKCLGEFVQCDLQWKVPRDDCSDDPNGLFDHEASGGTKWSINDGQLSLPREVGHGPRRVGHRIDQGHIELGAVGGEQGGTHLGNQLLAQALSVLFERGLELFKAPPAKVPVGRPRGGVEGATCRPDSPVDVGLGRIGYLADNLLGSWVDVGIDPAALGIEKLAVNQKAGFAELFTHGIDLFRIKKYSLVLLLVRVSFYLRTMELVERKLGLRTLVIGASSGIGREVATQLVAAGARVVAAARRVDRLVAIPGVDALGCDVRNPAQCEEVVKVACELLGGLDALVYAAGLSRITPLDRAGVDDWLAVFETNMFGAALVARAAIPHLSAHDSEGRALFLSSDACDLALPGLVAYSASKAALSRFCQGLSDELPSLKVSEIVIGPTAGTEIVNAIDPAEFEEWAGRWFEGGFVRHGMQQPADAAKAVLETLMSTSPPTRLLAAGPVEASASTLAEGRRQAEEL